MKPVWVVVAVLAAAGTGIGLWLGNRARLDEGAVIVHYAARYVAQTGGVMGDCHGVPGRRPDVWVLVLCEGTAGRFAYPVGHDGALVDIKGEEA